MGEGSAIEWTRHTFNPWRGCARVSPGCQHCYAETLAKRNPAVLGTWGVNGSRVIASESMWHQPVKWNAAAEAAGERHRVFCASLADVFEDRPDLLEARLRLWELIWRTPSLDWLLLTKRPENLAAMLPWRDGPWSNVWLGTTAEDQRRADARIPLLLQTPAAVRFVSAEPLLGPLDLTGPLTGHDDGECPKSDPDCIGGDGDCHDACESQQRIDWVIVGGESGGGARPLDLSWARSLVHQCKSAGAACFVKQLGAAPRVEGPSEDTRTWVLDLDDWKGGEPSEWPLDLRVREFPGVRQCV